MAIPVSHCGRHEIAMEINQSLEYDNFIPGQSKAPFLLQHPTANILRFSLVAGQTPCWRCKRCGAWERCGAVASHACACLISYFFCLLANLKTLCLDRESEQAAAGARLARPQLPLPTAPNSLAAHFLRAHQNFLSSSSPDK